MKRYHEISHEFLLYLQTKVPALHMKEHRHLSYPKMVTNHFSLPYIFLEVLLNDVSSAFPPNSPNQATSPGGKGGGLLPSHHTQPLPLQRSRGKKGGEWRERGVGGYIYVCMRLGSNDR